MTTHIARNEATAPRLIFTTETGSRYFVDRERKVLCRLHGAAPPTARVGDGESVFESVSTIEVGSPVVVFWGKHARVKAVPGAEPATVTSCVTQIEVASVE